MAEIRVWTGHLPQPMQVCFCVDTHGWLCETHALKGHPHDDCGAAEPALVPLVVGSIAASVACDRSGSPVRVALIPGQIECPIDVAQCG